MGVLDSKESWYAEVLEQFNDLCAIVDEQREIKLQQLKARREKTDQKSKFEQEKKRHAELTVREAELSRRDSELDRVCATFKTKFTITDSDKNRLEHAEETYKIAKNLFNIRWDFSAPPDVAKGYIKSESQRLLLPFELTAEDTEALWALLKTTASPVWNEDYITRSTKHQQNTAQKDRQ